MKWDDTHKVETRSLAGGQTLVEEYCTKCGLNSLRPACTEGMTSAPCKPTKYYYEGADGELYAFQPYGKEILPMPELSSQTRKFWNRQRCICSTDGFNIGYALARHRYTGLFCIVCDSESITGIAHCHCAACGGICQVG